MMEPRWIKLVRANKVGVPLYDHPDGGEVRLSGKFNVRWPDGTVSAHELTTKDVYTKVKHSDTSWTDVCGPYSYFEVPFNGMTVIYNLNEVELRADEVEQCRVIKKRGKAA